MTTKSRVTFVLMLIMCISCDQQNQTQETNLLTSSQSWGFGILAGFGVSLIGFLMAGILVCIKQCQFDKCFKRFMKFLFTLACGALLGDVFIHILPVINATAGVDSTYAALALIGSLIGFMILEKSLALCGFVHKHWDDEDHDHTNNQKSSSKIHHSDHFGKSNNIEAKENSPQSAKKQKRTTVQAIPMIGTQTNLDPIQPESQQGCLGSLKDKGSSGYINLIGSLVHNFVDGLTIGLSFATGDSGQFIPVLVAIIAHEIPRQMGDVAILLNSRFSSKQTIFCNGTVNLISIVGTIVGLGASVNISIVAQQYVMTFVAANFIFVAADIWKNMFKSTKNLDRFLELFGVLVGVAAMYLIVLLQNSSGGEHDHDH